MNSLRALQAALAQQTGEVFLTCLTIDHPSLSTPLRIVDDTKNLSRDAGLFKAWPFRVNLPGQQDDRMPVVTLTFDNVDRTAGSVLRSFPPGVSPTVKVEVVLAETPNVVEAGPFVLTLKSARMNAGAVECDLSYEDFLNEAFPEGSFNPSDFPGLFI